MYVSKYATKTCIYFLFQTPWITSEGAWRSQRPLGRPAFLVISSNGSQQAYCNTTRHICSHESASKILSDTKQGRSLCNSVFLMGYFSSLLFWNKLGQSFVQHMHSYCENLAPYFFFNKPGQSFVQHTHSYCEILAPYFFVTNRGRISCSIYARAIIVTLGLGRPSAGRELGNF